MRLRGRRWRRGGDVAHVLHEKRRQKRNSGAEKKEPIQAELTKEAKTQVRELEGNGDRGRGQLEARVSLSLNT